MRRIMMILLTTLTCSICKGQSTHDCITGLDITSVFRSNEFGLLLGISATGKWSVCGITHIKLPTIKTDTSSSDHKSDLGIESIQAPHSSTCLITPQISAQYWPFELFRGPMLSFGLSTDSNINIDIPLSAGYLCPIGKHLYIIMKYELNLLETIQEGKFKGPGVSLGIGYRFNKKK